LDMATPSATDRRRLVDLGLHSPLMDTRRARAEMGWEPRHTRSPS
jgi:hypothetical protein